MQRSDIIERDMYGFLARLDIVPGLSHEARRELAFAYLATGDDPSFAVIEAYLKARVDERIRHMRDAAEKAAGEDQNGNK